VAEDFDELGGLGYVDFVDEEGDGGSRGDGGGLALFDPERSSAGYTLYNDLPSSAAFLLDPAGGVVARWSDPGRSRRWLRAVLAANGDLLVVGAAEPEERGGGKPVDLRKLRYLLRLRFDGEIVWRRWLSCHHDVDEAADGSLLTIGERGLELDVGARAVRVRDNVLLHLDAQGRTVDELPLLELLLDAGAFELPPELAKRRESDRAADLLHANTARWLEDVPADHPFAGADVLVTLRHADLVLALAWDERQVVWSFGPGVLEAPHEATLLGDGCVLVFDNGRRARGYSRVLEVDPRTDEVTWEYRAAPDFFSESRGTAQGLPGGNVLVADSNAGEIFEVTRDGAVVWRYLNPVVGDDGRGVVRARRYPPDFYVAPLRRR
jgi:hypothetical protein